jgi:hypothetical protein
MCDLMINHDDESSSCPRCGGVTGKAKTRQKPVGDRLGFPNGLKA